MLGDGPAWTQTKNGATMEEYFQAPPCAPHVRRSTAAMLAHGMVLHGRGFCGHTEDNWRAMPQWLSIPEQVSCNRGDMGNGHSDHVAPHQAWHLYKPDVQQCLWRRA